jgi:hypothetical protein
LISHFNELYFALKKKQEFGRFNKVFPFYKITGWRPLAKNFRLTIGLMEVVCGAILVLIPGPAKELASFVLLVLMAGGFYTHFSLNDSFERMAPSLIFGMLIICRLIILNQVNKKERKEEEMIRKFLEEAKLNGGELSDESMAAAANLLHESSKKDTGINKKKTK